MSATLTRALQAGHTIIDRLLYSAMGALAGFAGLTLALPMLDQALTSVVGLA